MLLTMIDTRENDRCTDPLLVKIRNENDGIDEYNDSTDDHQHDSDIKDLLGAKWRQDHNGLIRNRRNHDETNSLSFNTIANKKRLLVFLALIVLLIYINTMAISWNDDEQSERVSITHQSHVPGMKARALKIINQRSTNSPVTTTPPPQPPSSSTVSLTTKNNNSIKPILPPPGYLVWSEQCKMPDLNPFASDVMKFFKRQKYEPCSLQKPLTRVEFNSKSRRYTLVIDKEVAKEFDGEMQCCYQLIQRSGKDKKADEEITLHKCRTFKDSEELKPKYDNILVRCSNLDKETYVNVHAMVPERPEIRERLDGWKAKMQNHERPLSVLMIGIDSVSRQNFIRAMPKTARYIYDGEWFELSGYNKIDDNTFPNLMAIFTGYNLTTANAKCNPYVTGYLDRCPIIWYDFRRSGYATAYAEDEESISTFNYLKVGFQKPPTDFYLRPAMMAAESNLHIRRKSSLTFCLGYKHSAEYVYDYFVDLATTYKDDPYFGIFWANTFSHNAISDASSMDQRMVDYLERLREIGALNNSAVIFFSDHGMRFGPTRHLPSGRIEERLPFFFMWLPEWFKKQYPAFVNGLNINKNRLTTPYDVHMTLKHILELTGRIEKMSGSLDCPNCQSLFEPVPQNRSCADASIEEHWCTCTPYKQIDRSLDSVRQVANFTVNYINNFLRTYKNGTVTKSCAKLRVNRVKYAYYAELKNDQIDAYQIAFETRPGEALFEATVYYRRPEDSYEITGSVSRLNSYAATSRCVNEGVLQKFCYCKST